MKVKCDSCGKEVEETVVDTCSGVKHPEKEFCDSGMVFCQPCLNKAGYCDWCQKLVDQQMKSQGDNPPTLRGRLAVNYGMIH